MTAYTAKAISAPWTITLATAGVDDRRNRCNDSYDWCGMDADMMTSGLDGLRLVYDWLRLII